LGLNKKAVGRKCHIFKIKNAFWKYAIH